MATTTPISERIVALSAILKDVGRSAWYLRAFFAVIVASLFASSIALWAVEAKWHDSSPVRCYSDAALVTAAAACSTDAGTLTPTTRFGQWLLVVDGLIGFMLLGIFIYLVQHALEGAKLVKSKAVFLATAERAQL